MLHDIASLNKLIWLYSKKGNHGKQNRSHTSSKIGPVYPTCLPGVDVLGLSIQ